METPARIAALCRGARRTLAVLAVIVAQGCATTSPPPDTGTATTQRWAGRFSAGWTLPGAPERAERTTGRFMLIDAREVTTLEVYSPFGQTVARAQSRPDGASLETSDGRRFEASDPEALTEAVLGWRIPMGRLPAWLSMSAPDRRIDHGWRIAVDGRDQGRPRTLRLEWPEDEAAQGAPRVTIRLVVDPEDGETRP